LIFIHLSISLFLEFSMDHSHHHRPDVAAPVMNHAHHMGQQQANTTSAHTGHSSSMNHMMAMAVSIRILVFLLRTYFIQKPSRQ
jgi:hypothetical protein